MVTHMVLFKLHDPTPANVQATRDLLAAMPEHIPQLRYIEIGANAVHSDRSYDVALVTRFDSWADLDTYRNHPHHLNVVSAHLQRVLATSAVVDWETA